MKTYRTDEDRLLTLEKVADLLDCHERTIRRMIADGELPAFRLGKRAIRVRESDVFNILTPIDPNVVEQGFRVALDAAGSDVEVQMHSPSAVREWGRANGYRVTNRGRLSSDLIAAYKQASAS